MIEKNSKKVADFTDKRKRNLWLFPFKINTICIDFRDKIKEFKERLAKKFPKT